MPIDLTTEYSPWDLLPVKEPRTESPPDGYFYHNVAKHLIPDLIRIMNNGIPIDLVKVQELEEQIDNILSDVNTRLQENKLIREFQILQYTDLCKNYSAEMRQKLKTKQFFIKDFDVTNIVHRSCLMAVLSLTTTFSRIPEDRIEGLNIPKWSVNDVKKVVLEHPALRLVVDKTMLPTNKLARQAMEYLASYKAIVHNEPIYAKLKNPKEYVELPDFNPGSSTQKIALFDWLGLESDIKSKKTGDDSWNRDQIERIHKETTDPAVKELTKALMDYSSGAIIKQNFIPAFYGNTIDHDGDTRLHGELNIFGAKTFRLTSNNP